MSGGGNCVCSASMVSSETGGMGMDAGRTIGFSGRLVGLCLLAAAACSCTGGRSGDEPESAQAATRRAEEELAKARADSAEFARLRARAAEREKARAADAARLPVLKRRFVFEPDEIRGGGWYTHVNQTPDNSWNRCYLGAPVTSEGQAYLRSRYYGDDWIFHTKVAVRIGDRVMDSREVPSYSELSNYFNSGGSVWETITFVGELDGGILAAIVSSDNATPITVRLEGGQGNRTFKLSDRDRAALKDSYELSRILQGRLAVGL